MLNEREPVPSQQPQCLTDLYKSWGVFDFLQQTLDELPPSYLKILNIARNLLAGSPVPGVDIPNRLMGLLERDSKVTYEKRYVTREWQERTILPSDRVDIKPMRTLDELPQVLPANLLLQEVAPDLFAYKAITGSLPIAEPQRPQVHMDEKSETLEELIPHIVKGISPRQKVYALLDISLSMKDAYKLFFAKAILMSYLIKANEEGAQIFFRAFAENPFDRIDCITEQQFGALARTVLTYSLASGTDVAAALQTAMNDIKEIDHLRGNRRAQTEILLISDCETINMIPKIPRTITLHTLHLNGGDETYHTAGSDRKDRLDEIVAQSKTFTRIDTSGLKLPPKVEDSWLLKEEVNKLEEKHKKMDLDKIEQDKEFQERVDDVRRMSEVYKKMYGDREIRDKAKALQRKISKEGIQERIMKKIKDAKNLKSRIKSRIKKLKLHRKMRLPGTLFDFRIKHS